MILTIKTDQPEAEISLIEAGKETGSLKWIAHRQLAETIHRQIDSLLVSRGLDLGSLTGIVVYRGPGSFTGLRIGLSVANALAYGLDIPIVGSGGQDWVKSGVTALKRGDNDKIALPEYGADPHITIQKR